ncbi:MAG TPA: hypothetical protein VGH02_12865 [Rhizomicrobium sp.]
MVVTIGGCGNNPNGPATDSAMADIQTKLKEQLVDPDSLQIKWDSYAGGYIYCGQYNAKNSMGGYSGFSPFAAVVTHVDGGQVANVGDVLIGSKSEDMALLGVCAESLLLLDGRTPDDKKYPFETAERMAFPTTCWGGAKEAVVRAFFEGGPGISLTSRTSKGSVTVCSFHVFKTERQFTLYVRNTCEKTRFGGCDVLGRIDSGDNVGCGARKRILIPRPRRTTRRNPATAYVVLMPQPRNS